MLTSVLITEYCTIEDIPQPSFTDYAIGPQFACEATIAKRPNEPFGGCDSAFPSKKAAKANAAKEAVFWLRQNGHMSEGPLKKKRKIAGAILAEGPGAVAGNGDKGTMSNAQKVNGEVPSSITMKSSTTMKKPLLSFPLFLLH